MTTIAYRAGIMASDSQAGRGDYTCAGSIAKIFRTREGVCGVTGAPYHATALVNWLSASEPNGEPPKIGDDASLIHIKASGDVDLYEGCGLINPKFEFMAWGSGMPAALGAMHAGASAEEAVRIACLVDPCSGGEVISLRVCP